MKYIHRRKESDPTTFTPEVQELWGKLVDDWTAINEDPMVFVKDRV